MPIEHRLHARCACGSTLSSSEFAVASRPFTLAGTKRVYERARPFTIRHIALDLAIDVAARSIRGSARIDAVRLDAEASEIALDAVGFEIESVQVNAVAGRAAAKGRRAAKGGPPGSAAHERGPASSAAGRHPAPSSPSAGYAYDGETLRIAVPRDATEVSLLIHYQAAPRRGLYFLEPDEHVPDRPRQVWTQCQDEDARNIFPCIDKPHMKQTTELRATLPAGWFCLSNGELVSDAKSQKAGTFHYRFDEPHPAYLFTLVAGEFDRLDDMALDIPVTYLVPKGRGEDGRRTFARTPDMIRHFSEKLGVKYPWKRYTQVVVSDFIFGGMENTTATTMYEHILLDERAAIDITSDDLIAHELAHQWFGDLVTCRDWSHGWLNEGFATFMEHVDREHHLGQDEYEHGLKADLDTYLAEARGRYRRPIVCQDYDAPIDIFDRHLYEKGGLVLHLLRRELGDDTFWQGVRTYLERHARGVAETRDLARALEDTSGRSLERFFEQWVFRAGHPELDVKIEIEADTCVVTVKQTQATSGQHSREHASQPDASVPVFAFDLVLDLGFQGDKGGSVTREIRRVDQPSQSFVIPVPRRPRFVVVDPELRILGEVRVDAPGDLLRGQLAHAPTARGRMLAAKPLGRRDDPPTTKALAHTLADAKEFWAVRAAAATALGALQSTAAFAHLADNAATPHAKVRRAVASALGSFRTAKAAELLTKLALRDASYLVEAEAARGLGSTRQSAAFDTLVDVLDRPSWGEVIRCGAVDGLANLRDERALPHLTARTRYGVPTRGRRAAILALPKLSTDRRTREVLEDLLDAPDPHLRVDVARALGELGDSKSRGALQRQLDRDLDGRVRRRIREVLRDLGGAGKREVDRLRDEIDALRRENAEIKSRLGKLEATAGHKSRKGDSK